MWIYDNSEKHDSSDETVPLFITTREREAEKLLFTIWGYQSIGSLSRKTSHFSTHCRNDSDEISEE